MGYRRQRFDAQVSPRRHGARVDSFVFKRRSARLFSRCGVSFFLALSIACSSGKEGRSTPAATRLRIGVPEANFGAPEQGIGQVARTINLEGFTQLNFDGRPLPRLAVDWTWQANDQQLHLKLREGVTLHDGRRFDSQLAAEALAIAISRGANRASYPGLRNVTAALPIGPYDLLLTLSQRSSLLPEDLTVLLDLPVGPYKVVKREGTTIELDSFKSYYQGAPKIAHVVLQPFNTLRIAWTSLLRGDVDVVSDVPADAVEFIRSDEVQVLPIKRWYQFLVAFNARRGPLQHASVRRALNIAVDRQALIRSVLKGSGTASTGPLWPQYWAYDNSIAAYPFDPALASSLLDDAGFPIRPSADPQRPPARFHFTCIIPENFSVWEHIAVEVQRELFNVGVDMRFKVVPFPEFNRLMGAGDFDAAMLDMISGPTPGRAYIFWASAASFRGVYNVFGYENPEVERLFSSLRITRNEAVVRAVTHRLQRALADDPPALFLAWNERARAVRHEFEVPKEPGLDPVLAMWRWSRRTDTLAAAVP